MRKLTHFVLANIAMSRSRTAVPETFAGWLSEHAIKSNWVKDEVNKAFEEERNRKQVVLFPIRLDDSVMDTNEAWAAKLRARNIGDFTPTMFATC